GNQPFATIQLEPIPVMAFNPSTGCADLWQATSSGPPWTVELGNPLVCTIHVEDIFGSSLQAVPVSWAVTGAQGGVPTFNCFTNWADVVSRGQSQPAALNQCAPPGPTYACITDFFGNCSVIFRDDPSNFGEVTSLPTTQGPLTLVVTAFATD